MPREDENNTEKKAAKPPRVFPFTFTLTRPIMGHGGEITELQLRELSADDLIEIETAPIVVSTIRRGADRQTIEVKGEERYDIMVDLAARMSGKDMITLRSMSAKDFRRLCTIIGEIWRETEGE